MAFRCRRRPSLLDQAVAAGIRKRLSDAYSAVIFRFISADEKKINCWDFMFVRLRDLDRARDDPG